MPRGVPKLGSTVTKSAPEILGTIPEDHPILESGPQGVSGQWATESGTRIDLEEAPPPWELESDSFENSDARRYVAVPLSWVLRWINPRFLESQGWRYWKPVMQSDPRVKVLVDQMVGPDGNIRRGGGTGDILAYMPLNWVIARRKQLQTQTAAQSDAAVRQQDELRDRFRQSGGLIRMEESRHPTHTLADGRSLKD